MKALLVMPDVQRRSMGGNLYKHTVAVALAMCSRGPGGVGGGGGGGVGVGEGRSIRC